MEDKILEVKNDRGNTILVAKSNIAFVQEGERGTNYIFLKEGSKYPIETTSYIGKLKAFMEEI